MLKTSTSKLFPAKIPGGVHSIKKVHAPFEQRVPNRTLNAWNINPNYIGISTPFFAFLHTNFFQMGRFTAMRRRKGEIFQKKANSGKILGKLLKKYP